MGTASPLPGSRRTDQNDSTRTSAIQAVFRIGGTRAKKILQGIAETDTDEGVQARASRFVVKLEEQGD